MEKGPNEEAPLAGLYPDVTPKRAFFSRNNFPIPDIDRQTFALSLSEGFDHPLSISLGSLLDLPRREVAMTMECAGNDRVSFIPQPPGEPWEGRAVSSGVFSGPSLRDILERAKPREGFVELAFRGLDGEFERSLPKDRALDPSTILAVALDGEELPTARGGPLRLVVPGWYGVASVKWVGEIRALDRPFEGHFQTERYQYRYRDGREEPVREVRVKSMWLSPDDGGRVSPGTKLLGRAWSGRGVTRVEVSLDGGPWTDATLGPDGGAFLWRTFEWALPRGVQKGPHQVRCRATDASGEKQPEVAEWNALGYGNNGIKSVRFFVE